MANHRTMTLDGESFVLVPEAEYATLTGVPAGAVLAVPFAMQSIGKALRAAREHAKLTQGELAAKLGKSQSLISAAESGRMRVGVDYVASVHAACGLPEDWTPGSEADKPAPPKALRGKSLVGKTLKVVDAKDFVRNSKSTTRTPKTTPVEPRIAARGKAGARA